MPKTIEIVNNFEWAGVLNCPSSVCSDQVKKILNHGIPGIWWEEIGSTIYPVNEVSETKRNILLYYLNSQGETLPIQHIRNTKRLKCERVTLDTQIVNLQEKCEKTENLLKEKALRLERIRLKKKGLETKKNLLELSYREMKDKIKNCKDMKTVCQNLLPPLQTGIDETTMSESLKIVGGISSRADKKKAWKQIQESLGPFAISELWDWILGNRIKNNEELCKFGIEEKMKDSEIRNPQLEIEISKARGQQIKSIIARAIHLEEVKKYQARGLEYLEHISELSDNEEITSWLTVLLEVTKFEAINKILRTEIEERNDYSKKQNIITMELHELGANMNEIDFQTEQCMWNLRKSLGLLESASNFLITLKDKLSTTLESIVTLNSQNRDVTDWMDNNLGRELEIFQENLNTDALNKIMLSGKVGAYRHTVTCMSMAATSFPILSSATPIFQPPLYHLVNCYFDIIINTILQQKKQESEIVNQLDLNLKYSMPSFTRENDIIDTLDEANSISKKCRQEITETNSICDAWCHQLVQEAMTIIENVVYGATFSEWVQRYSTLIYMLQRFK